MAMPEQPLSDLTPVQPPSAEAVLFVLVAGEASGDLLGADLIGGLRARASRARRFAGVVGSA